MHSLVPLLFVVLGLGRRAVRPQWTANDQRQRGDIIRAFENGQQKVNSLFWFRSGPIFPRFVILCA